MEPTDIPEEDKPFKPAFDADKALTPEEVELFRDEIEFLENIRNLIDALKKHKKPTRTANAYTIVGLGRDKYLYPPVVDDFIGKKEYSTIDVTVSNEDDNSATTVELNGSFGTVYLSRDALGPEDDDEENSDHIIGDSGKSVEIDRVPNSQINDLLYSITRQGIDPAITRSSLLDSSAEKVVGVDMRDALESVAASKSVYYTYELGDNIIVWFSEESSIYGDRLNTVSVRYKDYDMNDRIVMINVEKGLDIRFRSPNSDNSLSDYLHSKEEDYAIALAVIQDETDKLINSVKQLPNFSLSQLPKDMLEEI